MAESLTHCHKMGILHLDVKPENFLVFYEKDDTRKDGSRSRLKYDPTDPDRKFTLRLADFGLSRKIKASQIQEKVVQNILLQSRSPHTLPYTERTKNLNTRGT